MAKLWSEQFGEKTNLRGLAGVATLAADTGTVTATTVSASARACPVRPRSFLKVATRQCPH